MKKITALLLAAVMLIACVTGMARAEETANVYDLFSGLLDGKTMTLTVTAEDVDLSEEIPLPGDMVCTACTTEDAIVITFTCDGEAVAAATLNTEGVTLETILEGLETISCSWETLNPSITMTREENKAALKISMTGPEQELINFSVKVTGTELNNYAVSVQAGFITGPGAIYALYDDFSSEEGKSYRCTAYTWDEYMLSAEGDGEETAEVAEDGTMTVIRTDVCTVLMDDDEIGTVTFRSELVLG